MILSLADAHIREAGGKARGLARLMELGVKVPPGIVLIPDPDISWRSELEAYLSYAEPADMAVRSSALAEDGDTTSFAGQFESFLNCSNPEEIIRAVEKCLGSADQRRVGSYREHFHLHKGELFPVIIQEMVHPTKSGVIFTADPVHHRTDQWMINVTTGLAEELLAGTETGEQILLSRNGSILQKGTLLSDQEIEELFIRAREISEQFQRPMDLEWALDEGGTLFWLQARPITALKSVHLNELDGGLFCKDEIFTRANIGEMMPGPVTPLTYSTFGRAIEVGLQDFYIASGVQKEFTDDWFYFRMFYNHLFFSMTRLVDIAEHVLLNKKENVEFAIMGETLHDHREINPRPVPIRIWNQMRQFRYLASAVRRMKKLERLAHEFTLVETEDPERLYHELDRSLDSLNEAYAHHYCASSQSGSFQSTLMAILSGGKEKPGSEHYRDAALLMSDLQDVESADVVHTIDALYEQFKGDREIMDWISSADPFNSADPLNMKSPSSVAIRKFRDHMDKLLKNHGHRCVREGELREKSWEEDPDQLYNLIVRRFRAGDKIAIRRVSYLKNRKKIMADLGWIQRMALNLLLKPARAAVARREYTKSLSVRFQQRIKKGYVRLAELMVREQLLDDIDQVFFLTHRELGNCLDSRDAEWKELAGERRVIFPDSFSLRFPDMCEGFPEPLPVEKQMIKINGNALQGLPVSTGTIEARIRIVESLKDAEQLEKGEIMACQYTDVGWTPYFSLAAGLITEIGSPLSHGAVVAREYGIPAIVNAKGALGFFQTGEVVRLDGGTGIIRRIKGNGNL